MNKGDAPPHARAYEGAGPDADMPLTDGDRRDRSTHDRANALEPSRPPATDLNLA